ncbi:MAG: TIGR01777 family oxidoreductase [Sphingomonadaceae bacterium]
MRVIITGGTGLIGTPLAAGLAFDGVEVVVLSRDPERHPDLPRGVRAEKWDARTATGWSHLADGADAIVNLAGESLAGGPWTEERKSRILHSRLNAGRAVLQAVESAAQKPRVVVQASAIGYYGPKGDEEVTEETPPGSDFLARVCVEWEASTSPVEEMGVRRAVIRSGIVLSTRGGALPRLMMPYRLFVGGPLGSGRQWYSWIHIADEVAAIRFLLENESARGPFNLTAPNPVTNALFSRLLGRALGRPSRVRTPAFALWLLLGEMATTVLNGQRVIPRRLQSLGFAFRFPHLEAALRDLFQV